MNVGKKAMCHPTRQINVMQVRTSSNAFGRNSDPSAKNGNSAICNKSTAAAMPLAAQTLRPEIGRRRQERETRDVLLVGQQMVQAPGQGGR